MRPANDKAQFDGEEADRTAALDADTIVARPSGGLRLRPRALVLMHWLTVLFLALAATVILTRTQISDKPARAWLLEIHRHFGLTVLALFALRVGLRLRLGRLPALGQFAWPMRAAAWLTHAALYAVILVLPVLGWMLSDAEGKRVHLFGLTLPQLVQPDFDRADQLLAWHQSAAWVLLVLSLLHVGAALWHHFVLRDAVLGAMWYGRRR